MPSLRAVLRGCSCRCFFLTFLMLSALLLLLTGVAMAQDLPVKIPTLGGSKAYMPFVVNGTMFYGSIFVGVIAGLITGVIGAGGGYILTPALMSFGIRGIVTVGTDQFHMFAKAIMGATIHRKMGNVHLGLTIWFVVGSLLGATYGGTVNRALLAHSPAMSDAAISVFYVIVLGLLGITSISECRRLRGEKEDDARKSEELTPLAKWLQGLPLAPRIRFDQELVPGGRSISVYPVILCGLIVGFVAAIMGVGGGFLTFPLFVYGLGVSTLTTVGTSILQILFLTGYSSVHEYVIYGFVFYSVAVGMLLGSLVGVQIGAMATKVMKASLIRVLFAITILAGFTNRLFALPRKLVDLGYLSLSRPVTTTIENTGTVIFFVIVGIFAAWILTAFFANLRGLRGNAGGRIITDRRKFAIGAVGLVCFFLALSVSLRPVFNGQNALGWADGLFNRLVKGYAYTHLFQKTSGKAAAFVGQPVDISIHPDDPSENAKLARLLELNGCETKVLEDGRVRITGDLGVMAQHALADADLSFQNKMSALEDRYGMSGEESIYCWWIIFSKLTKRYTQENEGVEANFVKAITTSALEPAYNFRGIQGDNIKTHAWTVAFLLMCYLLFTIWYGFSVLYLFEGLGISTEKKKEDAPEAPAPVAEPATSG